MNDSGGMKTRALVPLALCALCLTSVGCEGTTGSPADGGPACADPCGGDVVGTWSLKEMCIDKSLVVAMFPLALTGRCPEAVVENATVGVAGTFALDAAGSYGFGFNKTTTLDVTVPASCVTMASCFLQAESFTLEQGVLSATCTGTGTSGCACTIVGYEAASVREDGTYTASGSSLFLTETLALSPHRIGYCVHGTTAAFRQEIYSTPGAFYTLTATKLW